MFGRSIYAIGGDAEAARALLPQRLPGLVRAQILLYVLVGNDGSTRRIDLHHHGPQRQPAELVGTELDIIAAVVLGGASIFGGRGSVLGTVLGVLLVQVIGNSLILAGVPSAWQRAAVGTLLIIGVGVQAVLARRRRRRQPTADGSARTPEAMPV